MNAVLNNQPSVRETAKPSRSGEWNLREFFPAFWNGKEYNGGLDILVLDDTRDIAIAYAIEHPEANIVAVSSNPAHLERLEELGKAIPRKNLTLKQCAVEQVNILNKTFDFIDASTNVQQAPLPAKGLSVVGSLLKADGVLAMACNARHGQTGIKMLRDLYRILEVQETPEEIQLIQSSLVTLRIDHYANHYLRFAVDLRNPSNVAPLFLHGTFPLYTVGDCIKLVEDAQLEFLGWKDNFYYYPDGIMNIGEPLYQHLRNVPDKQLWKMMELLIGKLPIHQFYACRSGKPKEPMWELFTREDFFGYIPVIRNVELKTSDGSPVKVWLQHPSSAAIPLNEEEEKIFRSIDGNKTVLECVIPVLAALEREEQQQYARTFFKKMWRCGTVFFKKK